MSDKVVAIISTAEVGKARTGAMYAVNALKHGWLDEVKIFFFGPSEELLLRDEELQRLLKEYQAMAETAVACKFIADRDGTDHEYLCIEHPFDEGFDLHLKVAEVFAQMIGSALGAMGGWNEMSGDLISVNLRALPKAIAENGGSKLIAELLEHTKREGESNGQLMPLNQPVNRSEAYSGNLAEMYRAVWEIIKANFDPFSMVNTTDWGDAWSEFQQRFPGLLSAEMKPES